MTNELKPYRLQEGLAEPIDYTLKDGQGHSERARRSIKNRIANGEKVGFAALDKQARVEMAQLGGRVAHAYGTAHRFTPEQAKEAGRKGGLARRNNKAARLGDNIEADNQTGHLVDVWKNEC